MAEPGLDARQEAGKQLQEGSGVCLVFDPCYLVTSSDLTFSKICFAFLFFSKCSRTG
jgi:hypothetical protein